VTDRWDGAFSKKRWRNLDEGHFENVLVGRFETTTMTAMGELLYQSGRVSSEDKN
jgi:hypothetical protein